MFLHFATIEMWPSQPGIELLTSCSAERHSHTTAAPQQVGCRHRASCRFIWTVQFSNANCSSPDVLICFLNLQLLTISCSCTAGIKSLRFTAPERKHNVSASWACSRICAFQPALVYTNNIQLNEFIG